MATITQRGFPVDFSKFKVSDWLMIGGGVAMLILGFVLPWSKVGDFTGDGPFDYFFTGGIAWIIVVVIGALAFAKGLGKLPEDKPWPLIFLIANGVAVILMLLRLILGGRDLGFGLDADRGLGMYGAFLWAILGAVGAYMSFTEAGGELGHLTDMDKMKSSFSGNGDSKGDSSGGDAGGDTPPPPPPPAPPAPPADPAPPAPPAPPAD